MGPCEGSQAPWDAKCHFSDFRKISSTSSSHQICPLHTFNETQSKMHFRLETPWSYSHFQHSSLQSSGEKNDIHLINLFHGHLQKATKNVVHEIN